MCDTCNDTRFVFFDGYAIPLPCPDCGDRSDLISRYEIRLERLFGAFVFASHLGLDDFRNTNTRRGKEEAVFAADKWTQKGGLLVLTGPSGVGKTTLGRSALAAINHKVPVFAIDAESMFDALRNGYDDGLRLDRIEALTRTPALLIDDLGRLGQPPASSHDTKALRAILDVRFQTRRATIITTNLSQDHVSSQYDKTIVSRLARWGTYSLTTYDGTYNGTGWVAMGGQAF